MNKGRLTKEEQAKRIRKLLSFIFIFRYATREQLEMFIKSTEGLLYPCRIIETSLARGYIKRYYKSLFGRYIYHLGDEGKSFLYDYEPYLPSGLKIAIEVETSYKNISDWKNFTHRYSHDIVRNPRYDAVFIMMGNKDFLTGAITKLFNFAPELSSKRFIFSDPAMLKINECFYQNEVRTLQEAFSLLDKEPKGNEKGI